MLRHRVQDGVLLRRLDKWLKAGVLEEGRVYRPETGVPQGGVVSPILSNVYLHEVLDQWFAKQVKPRLKGRAHLTRYADDFVLVFESEEDARRVQEVRPLRFGKYGLRLHPDKTRLLRFEPPTRPPEQPRTQGRSKLRPAWADYRVLENRARYTFLHEGLDHVALPPLEIPSGIRVPDDTY